MSLDSDVISRVELRRLIEDKIETLIRCLDALDGDPDFEPDDFAEDDDPAEDEEAADFAVSH